MRIIDKVKENIKYFIDSNLIDEIFWIVLVVFVAIGSFSLGMRHQREIYLLENQIIFEKNNEVALAWREYSKNRKINASYFASKNGSVYYPLACPSGDRIKEENRIYFNTEEDAVLAGYRNSTRCH